MRQVDEDIVREFMAAWGDGTQEEPDIEKVLSMFSEDAVWQLWVPGGPVLRGRDSIRADIARQLRFATYMQCGPLQVASGDGVVITERLDHFRTAGRTIDHHLVAVFELAADGKITAWREYFDPEDVNRQLQEAAAAKRSA